VGGSQPYVPHTAFSWCCPGGSSTGVQDGRGQGSVCHTVTRCGTTGGVHSTCRGGCVTYVRLPSWMTWRLGGGRGLCSGVVQCLVEGWGGGSYV
jgi:hypothetical protein